MIDRLGHTGSFRQLAFFVVVVFAGFVAPCHAWGTTPSGGILGSFRHDVQSHPGPASSSSGPSYSDYDETDMYSGELLLMGIAAPFAVPHCLADDDFTFDADFPLYPYQDDHDGYLLIEDALNMPPKSWGGLLRFDYASNTDDLYRLGGQLRFETNLWRLGLDTEGHWFEERLADDRYDHLNLGDCNFTFRFAQSDAVMWRTGLGFNWLDDSGDTDFGFNFTYGLDWFPCKPWVIRSELDWGTLGHGHLFRFRTTGGITIRGLEVYTGFEYLDVGGTAFNGLIGGVGLSF